MSREPIHFVEVWPSPTVMCGKVYPGFGWRLWKAQNLTTEQLETDADAAEFCAECQRAERLRRQGDTAKMNSYTLVLEEDSRRIVLLALHKLKAELPGCDFSQIETQLGGQLNWPSVSKTALSMQLAQAKRELLSACALLTLATGFADQFLELSKRAEADRDILAARVRALEPVRQAAQNMVDANVEVRRVLVEEPSAFDEASAKQQTCLRNLTVALQKIPFYSP